MENNIPQDGGTPVQSIPNQTVQSTQPIIQVIIPDIKPTIIEKHNTDPIELTGENSILKETNNLYGATLIVLSMIIIAGIVYGIGRFRTSKIAEPDLNLTNPTTTNNDTLFFNTQPGNAPSNSNPEGSDTAPPGGINTND